VTSMASDVPMQVNGTMRARQVCGREMWAAGSSGTAGVGHRRALAARRRHEVMRSVVADGYDMLEGA
jgi:hypothetical protein